MRAGQRGDEGGFAVVYMPGGANDAHGFCERFNRFDCGAAEALGMVLLGLGLAVTHDAFVGGQPFVRPVHQFLQLRLGGFGGLVQLVLHGLGDIVEAVMRCLSFSSRPGAGPDRIRPARGCRPVQRF